MISTKPTTDLSYEGVMFSLHFLIKIVLGFLWIFLVQRNLNNLLTTLDIYYKNYFGSTASDIPLLSVIMYHTHPINSNLECDLSPTIFPQQPPPPQQLPPAQSQAYYTHPTQSSPQAYHAPPGQHSPSQFPPAQAQYPPPYTPQGYPGQPHGGYPPPTAPPQGYPQQFYPPPK